MTAERKTTATPQPTTAPEVPELVAAGPDQKNWRGIGIALLVIVAVCALIVTAVVLLTPGDKGPRVRNPRISLEEVVKGYFGYRRFNGTWISGKEFVFQDPYGALEIYDAANNTRQVIMSNTTFRQHNIATHSISPDRKYVLLSHKYSRIFRHTYEAVFMVYNISNDYLSPQLFPEAADLHLQYAAWGPKGNQLVYVLDNNIYYLSEIGASPRQLTTSGVPRVIYNGIPDWLYEEEILSSSNAIWWSDDGTKLCFATFNDSEVDEIMYPYYGSYSDTNNVYPEIISLKYPKVGKVNPTVTLWVAFLNSSEEPHEIQPPKDYRDLDYYFTQAQWVDNDTVSIIWLKRAQNSSVVSMCKAKNGWICEKNLQEDSKGWVDLYNPLVFTADKKSYFIKLPGPSMGSAGRFRHVAMVDVKTGKRDFLTSGKYDIMSILAHSHEKKTVYYISTLEDKSGERHLFGVTDLTDTKPRTETCFTCSLDSDCLFNNVAFSPDTSFYVLECLGPGIPKIELYSTDSNKLISVLDPNDELRALIDKRALPQERTFQVPIDGNYKANVKLFLPPGLRDDEITKYPMLVDVYAGPGSQMITEKFSIGWGTYLASKKNIIYAWIDGRGSGNRGDKILHELYRRLGTVEVEDQISVVRYLKDDLPFIDGARIGIFGWSYGGYVTAMALATDNQVFSCGISVAPVTNWLYYDSTYTERYMQSPRPKDNYVNYERADVMKKAANFKGKKYLLVHGTADDNVHWQQSMMLAKALTDAGVIFRIQVYPDESHALSNVKLHLYHTIEDFLDQCFVDKSEEDDLQSSKNEKSER